MRGRSAGGREEYYLCVRLHLHTVEQSQACSPTSRSFMAAPLKRQRPSCRCFSDHGGSDARGSKHRWQGRALTKSLSSPPDQCFMAALAAERRAHTSSPPPPRTAEQPQACSPIIHSFMAALAADTSTSFNKYHAVRPKYFQFSGFEIFDSLPGTGHCT